MFVVLTLLAATLCELSIAARSAVRAHRENRPSRHLTWVAAALGLLSLALSVYAYGMATTFYFWVDEQCPARGVGDYVTFQEQYVPLSGELRCTEGTIEFVPGWVNPTLMALLVAGCFCAAVAAIAWRRSERVGNTV